MSFGPKPIASGSPGAVTAAEETIINSRLDDAEAALGSATDEDPAATTSALTTHTGAASPHSGHELTSNKDANSGYAGLDVKSIITFNQMPVTLVDGRLEYVDATTLKWAFLDSSYVGLFYDGRRRLIKLASEPTLAASGDDAGGNAITYDKNYSVFMQATGLTSASLFLVPWYSDTARAGAWLTTTNYYFGDPRTNGGNTYVCLSAHTSGTFATDLAAGKWLEVESDGLGRFEGAKVFGYSASYPVAYLHVGDVRLVNDSGAKFAWTDNIAYVWNRYHQRLVTIKAANSTPSWTYASTTVRQSNGGTGQTQGKFICGTAGKVKPRLALVVSTVSANVFIAPTIDSITASLEFGYGADVTYTLERSVSLDITLGYHYLTSVEKVSIGTATFFGGADFYACDVELMM